MTGYEEAVPIKSCGNIIGMQLPDGTKTHFPNESKTKIEYNRPNRLLKLE